MVLAMATVASPGCGRQRETMAFPLSKSEVQALSKAKTVSEIFDQPREVQLETNAACAIADISDMDLDARGNFILADGWRLRQVYIFSSDGRFIRILGRQGQGPGEYSTPVSLAVNSTGEILVSDYLRNQILVFDIDYQYLHSLTGKPRIHYFVHLNARNDIYTYSGTVGPGRREAFNTVYKLDKEGAKVLSFAPVPQTVLDMNFSAVDDGMTIDKEDFIYEMNPLYYQVRKYTADGKFVKSFSNPHYRDGQREGKMPAILNGPHYLEKGLLVVQREKVIDIFDTEGNFLAGEIPLPQKIVAARGNTLYCEEWEETPQKVQANPKIICYDVRRFAR
jgi:hypothetical protein